MILAGNQPYYLPYIGYWQLMNRADIYVVSDDYQYIDKGWVNRNRILINGEPKYFRVELEHGTSNKMIHALYLREPAVAEKIKTLQIAYGKAPFFRAGMQLMEEILLCPERNLADFLVHSIERVRAYLGITTPMVRSSALNQDRGLKREHRIYDTCRRLGADVYCNPIGGTELYSYADFRAQGIRLEFLKANEIKYRQFRPAFVPNLSILDVIMFNSPDVIREMLNCYTILSEESEING